MIMREQISEDLSNVDSGETRNDLPNVQSNYNPEIFKSSVHGPKVFNKVKQFFSEVRASQIQTVKICSNVVIVLLATAVLTSMFTPHCASDTDTSLLELFPELSIDCMPFLPNVSRVVIDVDLNSSTHCYSSKSCVELGNSLHKQQGKFRYNFIFGAFGFIFAPLGYNCASEEWEEAMYIRLPVESIYQGQDFMAARNTVAKLYEVLREGLECGKLQDNFTIVASGCVFYNSWCTKALQNIVTDESGEVGTGVRLSHFDDARPGYKFNPLSLQRVYSYQYKLVACDQNHG